MVQTIKNLVNKKTKLYRFISYFMLFKLLLLLENYYCPELLFLLLL